MLNRLDLCQSAQFTTQTDQKKHRRTQTTVKVWFDLAKLMMLQIQYDIVLSNQYGITHTKYSTIKA